MADPKKRDAAQKALAKAVKPIYYNTLGEGQTFNQTKKLSRARRSQQKYGGDIVGIGELEKGLHTTARYGPPPPKRK